MCTRESKVVDGEPTVLNYAAMKMPLSKTMKLSIELIIPNTVGSPRSNVLYTDGRLQI